MYLVYNVLYSGSGAHGEIIINTKETSIEETDGIDTYDLSVEGSIRELFMPSHFKTNDVLELLEVLGETQGGMSEIEKIEIFTNSNNQKVSAFGSLYEEDNRDGLPIATTLKKINLPRLIYQSISSSSDTVNQKEVYDELINIVKIESESEKKINKVLRYPKFVGVFILCFFYLSLFVVIPNQLELIKTFPDLVLPPLSQWFFDQSEIANEGATFYVTTRTILVYLLYRLFYFSMTKIVPYLPVIKKIPEYKDIILFFTVLRFLKKSGHLDYLAIAEASQVISNDEWRDDFTAISDKMGGGQISSFSEALKELEFDPYVVNQLYYGQKTNNDDYRYEKIIVKYRGEMDEIIEKALSMINPLILIIVGSTLGTIFYAIQAPIFSLGDI
jgi:type II secretory pathway component PulF